MLDRSPADGVPLPAKQVTRDRVLSDGELAKIILAARQTGGPYGDIVEVLALTGQRREEVARCTWDELDLTTRSRGDARTVRAGFPVTVPVATSEEGGTVVRQPAVTLAV